jgi:hypothetical protein
VEVTVGSGSVQQQIRLCKLDDICYAFLPAYADLSAMKCSYGQDVTELWLDGHKLVSGQLLDAVEPGKAYEMKIVTADGGQELLSCIFLQSENLPSVFVDTVSGSMDYVNEVKGNEEMGTFICVTAEGKTDSESVVSWIRGRGNSSWDTNYSGHDSTKNSYTIHLREETDVLQMGDAKNWVLQANKQDDSMMKNKLSYDFAKDIGVPYAVDAEFADLYFNGEYWGTYLICEKVEMARNRIDPAGKYLIERDNRESDQEKYIETLYGRFSVHTPEKLTDSERSYLTDFLTSTCWSIQDAAKSDDYLNYIDVESFARLYAMNEISNDPDANRFSAFYYKEDDNAGRLKAGPVWDFDFGYGSDQRGSEPLVSCYPDGWFRPLYYSETFNACLMDIFEEIHDHIYENYQDEYFDAKKNYLAASYYLNAVRWQKIGDREAVQNMMETSVDAVRDYFAARITLLDAVFNSDIPYCKVSFVFSSGEEFRHTYVKAGETLSKEVVEYLRTNYGIIPVKIRDGEEIDWETYQITQDTDMECR